MATDDQTAKTILGLNDDCLLTIFEMLDLRTQGELKMVCQRFKHLIMECWSIHCKAWRKNDYITGSLTWMTLNLRDFVEQIDMMEVYKDEFEFLSNYAFPNVKYLKFCSDRIPSDMLHKIVVIFPNLTQLDIEGDISMRTILLMRNLTDLTIEFVKNTQLFGLNELFKEFKLRKLCIGSHLAKIDYTMQDFKSVQECVTLEEISLTAELLHKIAPLLEKVPKLRIISCFAYRFRDCVPEKSIFSEVLDIFGKRVTHLISDNRVHCFPMDQLSKLPKMHTWTMKDKLLSSYDLETVRQHLKNLFELHLIETKSVVSRPHEAGDYGDGGMDFNPLELLSACPNLRTLALPFIWVNDIVTLEDVVNLLASQNERQVPLTLRCYEHECNNDKEWEIRERHQLLSVCISKYPEEQDDDRYAGYHNGYRMFKLFLDR